MKRAHALVNAAQGDFIKDLSPACRSLGYVMSIDILTGMMHVKFPKIGKLKWLLWKNYGHYLIIK